MLGWPRNASFRANVHCVCSVNAAQCVFLCSQDLMNREKKNKIPSMQVGFIDAICLQLYEVFIRKPLPC